MNAFFHKVKSIFNECRCELEKHDSNEDTINFYQQDSFHTSIKFNLNVFIDKLNRLVENTPQLVRRIYICIHYKRHDSLKNVNIFGKEVPRIIGRCMDYAVKPDDIESVAEDFFRDVDRERFVDFTVIEVAFEGINDV